MPSVNPGASSAQSLNTSPVSKFVGTLANALSGLPLAVGTSVYDPVTGAYLGTSNGSGMIGKGPNQALPIFTRALQQTALGVSDTRIALAGDSTYAGAYASGVIWAGCRPLSAPCQFGGMLLNSGLPVAQGSVFGNGASGTTGSYDPRISASTANWSVYGPGWLGGGNYRNDTNEASTLSFFVDEAFDTIDVYYLQATSGANFTIGIDGGSAIGATVATAGTLATIKVSRSCHLGSHSVNINRLAGAGPCCISAIVTSSTAKRQVQVYNWGIGGATIGGWTDNTNIYNSFPGIATLAPHLTIINVGINDSIAGTVPSDFTTAYQLMINQCRLSGDVVIQIPSPVASSIAPIATQDGIYFALRALAAQNGVPVVDMYAAYGSYTAGLAAGYFQTANNTTHPGLTGYTKYASGIYSAVYPL